MPVDPEDARALVKKDREWRERNRTQLATNPVLVCAKCGWKIAANDAKSLGVTACQQCGSRECRVHALDYVGGDNAIQVPPNR